MKPILFNTEMVRAILDGRKTVTRRIIKPQPYKGSRLLTENLLPETIEAGAGSVYAFSDGLVTTPIYKVGDYLYVRETWFLVKYRSEPDVEKIYYYRADGEISALTCHWKPSIHMPKEAARIFLRVTDVRVERLQDIEISDLQEEGFLNSGYVSQYAAMTTTAFEDFKKVWNSTVKKSDLDLYGWNANPWVWVIEFERISKEEAYGRENRA